MQPNHVILGVHIDDRIKEVPDVQKILTKYGCQIKTRIGLHHVDEKFCSPRGLILLELYGDEKILGEMTDTLSKLDGVEVQKMVFKHPE